MASRARVASIQCPECGCRNNEVVKEHNPETTDMNMRVTLRCLDYGHTWEGRVMSHHTRKLRREGRVRL